MLRFLKTLRRRSSRRPSVESPWDVLSGTGNGIGGAPLSLRRLAVLSDRDFERVYLDELFSVFLHQGTAYLATPFAIREVMKLLQSLDSARSADLVYWFRCCLWAESLGRVGPSRAGLWLPATEEEQLLKHGIVRPTVREVLIDGEEKLARLAESSDSDLAEDAQLLLESLRTGKVSYPDDP